jgi:hypothetical protein
MAQPLAPGRVADRGVLRGLVNEVRQALFGIEMAELERIR